MKELSAHAAKREGKKAASAVIELKYTINGTPLSVREVFALARKINPEITTNTLRARLERGHRDMKLLAADKLPAYRPKVMRGHKS